MKNTTQITRTKMYVSNTGKRYLVLFDVDGRTVGVHLDENGGVGNMTDWALCDEFANAGHFISTHHGPSTYGHVTYALSDANWRDVMHDAEVIGGNKMSAMFDEIKYGADDTAPVAEPHPHPLGGNARHGFTVAGEAIDRSRRILDDLALLNGEQANAVREAVQGLAKAREALTRARSVDLREADLLRAVVEREVRYVKVLSSSEDLPEFTGRSSEKTGGF